MVEGKQKTASVPTAAGWSMDYAYLWFKYDGSGKVRHTADGRVGGRWEGGSCLPHIYRYRKESICHTQPGKLRAADITL
jgi:hypothetical protein